MPFNSRQNVAPYYTNRPCTPTNSILVNNSNSFRKTNVSASPLQHHQELNLKAMPKSFPLSQVSSTSSPLYSNTMASSKEGTTLLSETVFVQNEDDMQPLDLSMRPNREAQTVKQYSSHEHKPICLVKSCICSTQPEHLSPHAISGQGVSRSPLPGVTLSSFNRADSPMYTQHQMLSSTYHATSSKVKSSPSSVPQISPWKSTQTSPFQLLVSTDKVLNGAQNSSGLFRPYDDHMHQDMNVSSCDEAEEKSLATLPKQHDYDDENDEPTYMDLDSTTAVLLTAKSKKHFTGNSSLIYGNPNSPQTSSVHNKNNEAKTVGPHQSPLLQALNSKKVNDFSDKRAATYFVGGVISHTSFEKSHKKIIGHSSIMPNSEQAAHPKPQQPHLPDSSTSPANVPVSTGHVNLYRLQTDTHPTTTFQHQVTEGHTGMLHSDNPVYSKTSMSSQHLPSSTNQMNLVQSVSKSHTDQDSDAGSDSDKPTSNKITSNVQLPVSSSMTSDVARHKHKRTADCSDNFQQKTSDGVSANKHRRTGDCSDENLQQVTSQQEGNTSTKISLLDFWISKILMERSIEASQPRKPCNVDYICTANGEKRIRLRLVDLMEMQVEQSMKA